MRSFDLTLGGRDAVVHAPLPEEFDPAAFRVLFPPGHLYGLDVEGTYMTDLGQFDPDFRLRMIQFATEGYAWVLDLSCANQAEIAVELLSHPEAWFASHTPMDVLSVALRLSCDITRRNIDTRTLASMAAPDDRKGGKDLKNLTDTFIGYELSLAESRLHERFAQMWAQRGERKNAKKADIHAHGWENIPADDEAYVIYAGLDAIAARRLVPVLMDAASAPEALLRTEIWLAGEASRMRLRGMRADEAALRALSEEATRETSQARARVTELTGGLSPLSPKLAGWLAGHGARWEGHPVTDTGRPSLDKHHAHLLLEMPLDADGREVASELLRFKAHQDALTRTNGILARLTPGGRVHPELNTVGTVTGRMSSSGPNFQNFSKSDPRSRGIFLPDEGKILIACDLDQVELRVVAALAREQKMIDVILSGGDLHQLTADEIGIDRQTAKMTNFLIVYGGGGAALSTQAGIPLEEARGIVRVFRERYPAIDALSRVLGERTDYVRTISGRRIPVTRDKKGNPRTYANINYVVQSSAREILVHAWHRFAHEHGRADDVWFAVHDELIVQAVPEEADQVMAEVTGCMTLDFMGVPISASAVKLIDEHGVSRWMPGSHAEKIAAARAGA